jgi:hypothetical protein
MDETCKPMVFSPSISVLSYASARVDALAEPGIDRDAINATQMLQIARVTRFAGGGHSGAAV